MKNFKRPKGEKPYYYASTIKNGIVVEHEGEKEHAIYLSEMQESTKRANLWHKWVEKNFKNAYDGWGRIHEVIYLRNESVYREFMDGLRTK